MTDLSHNEQLRLARLLITNLTEHEDLKRRLPTVGVDVAAALAEGQLRFTAADTLVSEQNQLTAKINGMWEDLCTKHDAALETYKRHHARALTVIESADLMTLLGLRESFERTRPMQLAQMRSFYREALSSAAAQTLLAEVNLTTAKLETARASITAMDWLEDRIRITDAAKQEATRRQDAALAQLNAWRRRLWIQISLVTEDAPMLRKAVGMRVRE